MKYETNLIRVLNGNPVWPPPLWLMRQAGRYLPEYRELRAKAGSFWTMCNSPELAAEVTLQPIRRFGFDAAIIFSDILTIPAALGCPVTFEEGEGPRLTPVTNASGFNRDPSHWEKALAPAYETLKQVRQGLGPETTLIGFAGAPWTLATYLAARPRWRRTESCEALGLSRSGKLRGVARCPGRVCCVSFDPSARRGCGRRADFRQLGFGTSGACLCTLGCGPSKKNRRADTHSAPTGKDHRLSARFDARGLRILRK